MTGWFSQPTFNKYQNGQRLILVYDRCTISLSNIYIYIIKYRYRSSWTVYTFRSLDCIYQLLQNNILLQRSHCYGVWKLLYCICYTIWIDWHMILDSNKRVGVWSLPWRWTSSSSSHLQQVEKQAPKPVGCMMCLLMTPVTVQLCFYIYIYIYIYI